MSAKLIYPLIVFIVAYAMGPSIALADYVITVTIGDTTLPPVTNGPVTIPEDSTYSHAATGGSVKINKSGGTAAQVEFTQGLIDSNDDAIRLINTRITAQNGNVTNFPIIIQGRMTANPTTPPALYYKMKAAGLFSYGPGSSILVGMYLKNPLTEGFTFLNQAQYTPGATNFSLTPPGTQWPPVGHADLSGDRILRVETAFKLPINRYLDFNTSANNRFIGMYNSASPDKSRSCDGSDKDCVEEDVPGLYLPGLLEWSDCHGRSNWFCRVFRFWCPVGE